MYRENDSEQKITEYIGGRFSNKEIIEGKEAEVLEIFRTIKFKTINAGYDYGFKCWDIIEQALTEFDEAKAIEKAIGCPLKVLKHLINGLDFFYEDKRGMHLIRFYNIETNTINFEDIYDYSIIQLVFTDYGKSFWLKEDKSE